MLKGVGASAGIGIGKVICIREQNLDYSQVQYLPGCAFLII